ncbi:MAG: polysaccharide deacetylase family protein [Rhodobiaceae bacterium]|nr:polysaccharide deacetylase family protein [Rhodobiaceae bacterium]
MTADARFAPIVALLDKAEQAGTPIRFWWRDDDAAKATPALDALLAISARHHVPVALAVIPAALERSLVERLEAEPLVRVFQHGWAHENHADKTKGERASEFGEGRPVAESLADLKRGHAILRESFGDRFLPVLTPPWNRIGAEAARVRIEAGLTGLSTFDDAHADDPDCINAHVDIINWKAGSIFAGADKTIAKLVAEIDARLAGKPAPIGILSHHLVHDDAANAFLDDLFSKLAHHPGAAWPPLERLFATA